MAKKNPASMKVAKKAPAKVEMRPIEDVFEEAKEMFAMTVETQIKTAKRVDNMLNIRDYAMGFWKDKWQGEVDFKHIRELHALSIRTYERVLEAVRKFELEDFKKREIKDYFDGIIPTSDSISNERELERAGIIFLSVRPYGDKMLKMHQLIQDEMRQRGMEPVD